ncbi:MAG: hypothetical protein P1V97_04415 [Planctomycetota bacterium]|nr:hypothetical protein [Planctomycetota bacterium]
MPQDLESNQEQNSPKNAENEPKSEAVKASKGVPPVFVIVVCLVVLTPYFYLTFFTKTSKGPALQKSPVTRSLSQKLLEEKQYISSVAKEIDQDLRGKDSWRYREGLDMTAPKLESKELARNEFRFFSKAESLIQSPDRLDAFHSWIISTNRIYKVRRNQFDQDAKIQKLIAEWN